MSGICDTCQRNRDCRRPMDGMDSCRLYVSGKESNYERLFGTPERAALTLLDVCENCGQDDCSGCQVYELTSGGEVDYYALLEWMEGSDA